MNINVLSRPRTTKRRVSASPYKRTSRYAHKYLLLGILFLLGAVAIALLTPIKVVELGFTLAFIGFGLALIGGILFIVQTGEIN